MTVHLPSKAPYCQSAMETKSQDLLGETFGAFTLEAMGMNHDDQCLDPLIAVGGILSLDS